MRQEKTAYHKEYYLPVLPSSVTLKRLSFIHPLAYFPPLYFHSPRNGAPLQSIEDVLTRNPSTESLLQPTYKKNSL